MTTLCPCAPINISKDREIINCDKINFNWEVDPNGYFLIKLENNQICCGFCTQNHKMVLELRGKSPDKIIKEIVKRKLCNENNLAYIAQELMIAQDCLVNKKKYVQR